MIARPCLCLFAYLLAAAALVFPARAQDDVTVISTPASAPAPQKKTASTDDPSVIHKSSHKKKQTATASTGTTTVTPAPIPTAPAPIPAKTQVVTTPVAPTSVKPATPPVAISSVTVTPAKPSTVASTPTRPQAALTSAPVPVAPTRTMSTMPVPTTGVPAYSTAPISTTPVSPTVETGLPIARYPGMGAPIRGVSTYTAIPMTLPPAPKNTHQPYLASALPVSVLPLTSTAAGSYSTPGRAPGSVDFTFANFPKKSKMTYPWRSGIITTTFWIGEGDTPLSHTTNVQSSWDEEWLSRNHGSDSPYDRNGYAAGSHASTLNPFYVALPFNDLAFPDKAHRFLPGGWYRRPVDGRPVSACKDRWIEIKNTKGDVCYAQWEDVGPLNYSDAEYVFGGARPTGMGDNHAGIDVSPAVSEYLNISDRNHLTSWRFVDDEDVRPGAWLKLDEQAVLYTALHQFKTGRAPTSELPIQKASEPIDENATDANKKKIDASKG